MARKKGISTGLRKVKSVLWDLLFPAFCLGCKKNTKSKFVRQEYQERYFCSVCQKKLSFAPILICLSCRLFSAKGKTCPNCQEQSAIDYFWFAADYRHPLLKKILRVFKYKFVKDLSLPLGRLLVSFLRKKGLARWLKKYQENIVVIPVPLHSRRWRWRSFNQAALLAEIVASRLKLKLDTTSLVRLRHTQIQADLKDRQRRQQNMQKAFFCRRRSVLKNKTVLLIDDVATSGSTLQQAALALKKAGVGIIIGLVVAKAKG